MFFCSLFDSLAQRPKPVDCDSACKMFVVKPRTLNGFNLFSRIALLAKSIGTYRFRVSSRMGILVVSFISYFSMLFVVSFLHGLMHK